MQKRTENDLQYLLIFVVMLVKQVHTLEYAHSTTNK